MTERLYYNDAYLSEFEAKVLDAGADGRTVILDRTAFYPTSGGQPNDLGTISGVPVTDVRNEDGNILHTTAEPVQPGPVRCQIHWPRRYDHMQQHTAQHLLSAVFVELLSAPTLSFHMGPEASTIELGCQHVSDEQIDRVEDRVNELSRKALPVAVTYAEAESAEGLRKPTKRTGEVRIITIAGIDRSACGGTHVRSAAELAPIHIRRTEKLRGNIRVEFVSGIRAQRRSRRDYVGMSEAARLLTIPVDDLPEHVNKLRSRIAELEKDRQRLSAEIARFEAADLHCGTQPDSDGIRRVFITQPAIDEALRARLQAFAARGRAIALAAASGAPIVLAVSSVDSGVNAGAVLKEFFAASGGRGGGSQTLAQGTLPSPAILEQLKARLGFTS